MITDKEIDDELFWHSLVRSDLTAQELSELIEELEVKKMVVHILMEFYVLED